jgi:hypothetical protein
MGLSWLNPLNWGKDLEKSAISTFEKTLLYVFSLLLSEFLSFLSSIFGYIMDLIESTISWIVSFSIVMGIFSLPVFTIAIGVFFGGLFMAFYLAKDLPVVGALI